MSESSKSGLKAYITFISAMGTITYITGNTHNKVAISVIPKVIAASFIVFPKYGFLKKIKNNRL